MFSLVITIIAIALVAALAIATLYYGGSAMEQSSAKSQATQVLTQRSQILAATELYFTEQRAWPASMAALVSRDYLKAVPVLGTGSSAVPWTQPVPGAPTFWSKQVLEEGACKEVNLQSRGDNGIYAKARPGLLTQCFGQAPRFTVVTTRHAGDAPALELVFSTANDPDLAFDAGGGGWSVAPTEVRYSHDPVDGQPALPGDTDYGTASGMYLGGSLRATVPTLGGMGMSSVNVGSFPTGAVVVHEVEFTNVGAQSIALNGTSSYGDFRIAGSTCAQALAPGQGCRVTVQTGPYAMASTPGGAGISAPTGLAGSVVLKTAPRVAHVGFKGSVYPAVPMALPVAVTTDDVRDTAARVQFPDTAVGQSSFKWVRTQNVGDAMSFGAPAVQATAPFSVEQTDCAGTLVYGASCLARIRFAPLAVADYAHTSHVLEVKASDGRTIRKGLSGKGLPAQTSGVALSEPSLNFGTIEATGQVLMALGLQNKGTAALEMPALPVITQSEDAFFVAGSTCGTGLAPGASCSVTVRFAPDAAQAYEATMRFELTGLGNYEVPLTGQAKSPVRMQALTLPSATKGQAYSASPDFAAAVSLGTGAPVDAGQLTMALGEGAVLPAGLTFNEQSRKLEGTPTAMTAPEGAPFKIVAHYQSKFTGEQVFTIKVGDATLDVSSISAGHQHTCAVTTGGAVKCWGQNHDGQLGDGHSWNTRASPVYAEGLTSGVARVAAGKTHSCALMKTGGVKCWGYNGNGELGDGTTERRYTATDVSGLTSGVSQIAAGHNHTCVLTTGGAVKCWGNGYYGQVGDGSGANRVVPVDVVGLSSGVTAISVGAAHSCAVTTGGVVKCWGVNNVGQLGDGTTDNKGGPVQVQSLPGGVTRIGGGEHHTCAVLAGGALKCWGYNNYGQVGDGTTSHRALPVDVSGLSSGVQSVAGGGLHTCAVLTGGTLKCWGYNYFGALGDGTTTTRYAPGGLVAGLSSGVVAVTAGEYHTCAMLSGGSVKCWGANSQGQAGDGTGVSKSTPTEVQGF